MSREWKPGDVALVTAEIFGQERTERAWLGSDDCWRFSDGTAAHASRPDLIKEVRPLVVIDPESDADIARVENALETLGCRVGTKVQAALRSLITPPRPEEPTGLGAVVEDADGDAWVRFKSAERAPWRLNRHGDIGSGCFYSEITVVRVLSEGVTA